MKIEITYATLCVVSIYEKDGSYWNFGPTFGTLKEAINFVQHEIDDLTHRFDIDYVYITDSNTGELLAECYPEDSDEYDDWDYNEDMGFDPYEGCYSFDC